MGRERPRAARGDHAPPERRQPLRRHHHRYGPECFTIRKGKWAREAVYTLQAHYFSRGPMGYGMGKLQIIDHDGKGGVTIEDRPFVVMADEAFVNMGTVRR